MRFSIGYLWDIPEGGGTLRTDLSSTLDLLKI